MNHDFSSHDHSRLLPAKSKSTTMFKKKTTTRKNHDHRRNVGMPLPGTVTVGQKMIGHNSAHMGSRASKQSDVAQCRKHGMSLSSR